MGRMELRGTYTAPAVGKAFEIVEALADHPEGASVSEIAVQLDRSVGELFRLFVVMEKLGYLHRAPATDRYTVAYKLLQLAFRATPAQDLVTAALPAMRRLALETTQSCHFVVVNGGQGLVIAREENPGIRGFALRLGAPIDLMKSCSGQVLLAFADDERRSQMIEDATQGSSFDHAALDLRLKTIRQDGYDSRRSPITYGVTDVSYPVFGFDGRVAGALTMPFLELIDGSQTADLHTAKHLLQDAAAAISERLGYWTAPVVDDEDVAATGKCAVETA